MRKRETERQGREKSVRREKERRRGIGAKGPKKRKTADIEKIEWRNMAGDQQGTEEDNCDQPPTEGQQTKGSKEKAKWRNTLERKGIFCCMSRTFAP